MSRYLSPSKICLLHLIELYRDGEVQHGDIITVLSFISTHILGRNEDLDAVKDSMQTLAITSIEDFHVLLSSLPSKFPGRSLYDVFLHQLWGLKSLEELADLFDKASVSDNGQIPGETPISSFSPMGQYLRRCSLEFMRLQFTDAQQLWDDLQLFREPSREIWAARNPVDANAAGELGAPPVTGLSDDLDATGPALLDRLRKRQLDHHEDLPSQDELERMVHFQLEHLQAYGCRVPDEMTQKLRKMLDHSSTVSPDVHFVNFFDAWRAGAYNNAIDHLHRYFDYAMEGYTNQQNIKTYHQYALLHLAVLHADFGCYDEAIAAMNECIATARENQDSRCLNFGLSWLIHLRKAHPEYVRQETISSAMSIAGNEADILSFLQTKALENKDYVQLSSSLLSQAEAEIMSGESVAKAFEWSYQSSHINHKYSLRSMEATQTRLHGALFARLGQLPLAKQQYTVFEEILGDRVSRPEALSMICLQAYQLATSGNYDKALTTLQENDPSRHRTLRMDNVYLGYANMIRLKRALHGDNMFAAERILRQLKPMRKIAEPDVAFETQLLELDYLQRQGELGTAFEKVQEMIGESKSTITSDVSHRIRLLIVKANIWARSGKASNGFSVALRAASAAHTRLLLPLLWEACSSLATILIDVSEFDGARAILTSIIPRALEGGDTYLIGALYSLLSDSYAGLAGHASGKERDSHLSTSLVYLNRAKEAFDRVEDLEGSLACLEKKAVVFRYRKEEALAEEMEGMADALASEARIRDREVRGLQG